MKQLDETRPQFATFFTNHVAASQHRFWAAAFPKDYERFAYDQKWVNTYSHEIEFAMQKFDAFFERLVKFVEQNREYVLWVTTSMGQEATEARALETQLYLVDAAKFTLAMGLQPSEWNPRPAMLPQWNALIVPEKVGAFRERLGRLVIDGNPITFREAQGGFFSLDFGQVNLYDRTDAVQLDGRPVDPQDLGLRNTKIEDKSAPARTTFRRGHCLSTTRTTATRRRAGRRCRRRNSRRRS